MNITYVANIRMPTENAHGVQIAKTCEAFARAGENVVLIVPKRRNPLEGSPFSYYGIEENFRVAYVPVLDTALWGKLGFFLETLSFARAALPRVRREKGNVLYGRDEIVLAFLILCGAQNVVWESHTGAWNSAARYVARRAKAVVVISEGLRKFYLARGVPKHKLLVARDGVSLADFARPEPKESARRCLGLPLDKKIALYIGGLGGWKGIDTLCKAAALLPRDHMIAIVGGEPWEIERFKKNYPQVLFLGRRDYKELPRNQSAADVLVLPNTAESIISSEFTSPLKLFTYMASRIPIVASDLPSIREVLDGESAYLVAPDDAQALAHGITTALSDGQAARAKADAAYAKVSEFDWQKRAEKILTFIHAHGNAR